jgi:hypothetical protein
MAIGDDRTGEDLFAALSETAPAIQCGAGTEPVPIALEGCPGRPGPLRGRVSLTEDALFWK